MEIYNSASSSAKNSLQKKDSYYPSINRQPPTPASAPLFPAPPIGTTLPTGMPAGSSVGAPPAVPPPFGEVSPQTTQSVQFIPGFLKTQIGRRVRVEFLIGTNSMTDRTGTLVGVGANYILIKLIESDDIQLADLYAIKFITFFM
jgi:hypothetical protein